MAYLTSNDVDVILLANRFATYGNELEITSPCPECKHENNEILDIETQAWMTSTEASHYMTFGRKSYIIDLNNIDKSSYELRHK